MSIEQRILCLAARTRLDHDAQAQLIADLHEPIDWEELRALVLRHQVWPLIDINLSQIGQKVALPPTWLDQMHRQTQATGFHNMLLTHHLLRIVKSLQDEGIASIPVKGTVVAETIYGNLALRPATDLDLLVHRGDLAAAHDVLHALGFAQDTQADFGHLNHALHEAPYSYYVGNFHVRLDLHWTLWAQHLFPISMDRMWERATGAELGGMQLQILSPEDTLLHLAIHRSRTEVKLRLVCDIAELLRRYGSVLDWEYVLATAFEGGARTALYNALSLAQRLLGAPLPLEILSRLDIRATKRFLLGATWGAGSLFRAAGPEGDVPELSIEQRLVMLDNTRQTYRGIEHRARRARKYLRTLVMGLARPVKGHKLGLEHASKRR